MEDAIFRLRPREEEFAPCSARLQRKDHPAQNMGLSYILQPFRKKDIEGDRLWVACPLLYLFYFRAVTSVPESGGGIFSSKECRVFVEGRLAKNASRMEFYIFNLIAPSSIKYETAYP